MNVEEAPFLEEIVDRLADAVAKPGDGPERVGSRTEVSDGAEELVGVALLLERVFLGVGVAEEFDGGGVNLRGLPLRGRRLHFAVDAHARAGAEVFHDRFVVGKFARRDDLHVPLARAVVQFDEAESALGIAARANPTAQANELADALGLASLGHGDDIHRAVSRKRCCHFLLWQLEASWANRRRDSSHLSPLKRNSDPPKS